MEDKLIKIGWYLISIMDLFCHYSICNIFKYEIARKFIRLSEIELKGNASISFEAEKKDLIKDIKDAFKKIEKKQNSFGYRNLSFMPRLFHKNFLWNKTFKYSLFNFSEYHYTFEQLIKLVKEKIYTIEDKRNKEKYLPLSEMIEIYALDEKRDEIQYITNMIEKFPTTIFSRYRIIENGTERFKFTKAKCIAEKLKSAYEGNKIVTMLIKNYNRLDIVIEENLRIIRKENETQTKYRI